METTQLAKRPARKFEIGQKVDTIIGCTMQVVGYEWEDYNIREQPRWIYMLSFLTRKGNPDRRQNYRRFPEDKLTLKLTR
jgi:hypothetical protein